MIAWAAATPAQHPAAWSAVDVAIAFALLFCVVQVLCHLIEGGR